LGLVYLRCWLCTANHSCNRVLHRCIDICVHLGLVYVRCWFCTANHSCDGVFASVHGLSVFVWDSCMYVVGFALLTIHAIVFLHRCIVLCVHLGLVYVCCCFCTANHFAIVFSHLSIVLSVHLGLVYVCCWFCSANHSCNRVLHRCIDI
jgi:hypothetical protein